MGVQGTPSSEDVSQSQAKVPAAKVLVGPLSRRVAELAREGRRLSDSGAGSFACDLGSSEFHFGRAWVPGVVVDTTQSSFVVDDGTGTLAVDTRAISKQLARRKVDFLHPKPGDYVMCVGAVIPPDAVIAKVTLKAHKVIAIDDPNRESLWHAETLHLYRKVYST